MSRRVIRRSPWNHLREPRLAFVSPLPPARTGVATYAATVVGGLRAIGFFERHRMDVIWPIEGKHEALMPWYRLAVYQVGNNVEFHRDVYRHAMQSPGLVVLHDLALDDLVRGLLTAGDPLGHKAKREALALAERMTSPDALENEPMRVPWCADVARRARGIVVHSEFGRRYLEEFGCRTPVFVVPHPVVEREEDMRRAEALGRRLRTGLGLDEDDVLVVCPGDMNEAKCLDEVLAAAARLDAHVRVALVGRTIEGYDSRAAAAASGLGSRVTVAADVADDEFRGWLFAGDVIVDLRFPHRGESSGSLSRAMQAGRPCVVSGTGAYLDIPDDAALHVTAGRPDPEGLAAAIGRLAADRDLRGRMGERARAWVLERGGGDRAARGYERAIEETLALVLDPTRRALARWAGALLDLGISEEDLHEGYGLSYARALADFTESR